MKTLKLGKLYHEFDRKNPPALSIEPGETVSVETEDTFMGQVRKPGDERNFQKFPYGNPLSGPIYIQGAEPGDTLAVHIHKIEARMGQAGNDMPSGRRGLGEFLGLDVPRATRICPVRDGKVWWSSRVGIPYAPVIGTIGTAPAMGAPTSGPAGPHGGNMDLREVTEGNTLFLPVFVPGALLHLGDAHAAQGEGEVCGTALEMPAVIDIKVDLLKGKSIARPRIRSPQEIMAVATGTPMERSVAQAYADLILWMEEEFGVPRWDGYSLCTQVGSISVGYYLIGTVAAKIRLEYVEAARQTG
jgi:acetamidase/formamidase